MLAALAVAAAGTVGDAVLRPAAGVVSATIANVQIGTFATVTTGAVTATLPAASTAGTLLVATLAGQKNSAFTGPTGWVRGPNGTQTNNQAEIWYYPNNPGGVTSATFTNSGTSFTSGQLSEWLGVATSPSDQTSTATSGGATSLAVSTSAPTSLAGDLAITSFSEALLAASTATFTAGTGWTNLAHTGATSSRWHSSADYRLGVAAGTVSETETSSKSGSWAGVVATFKPVTCTGGTLGLTPPASAGFPALTLNGQDETATATTSFSPNDMTGSAAGWNVQGTSTTFATGTGATLPTTATRVTAASATAATGTCSLPTNAVTYPATLPAAATPPASIKLYNAATSTGGGPSTVTLTFMLTVPANARTGSYSSTWTFSITSAP